MDLINYRKWHEKYHQQLCLVTPNDILKFFYGKNNYIKFDAKNGSVAKFFQDKELSFEKSTVKI